MWAKCHITLNDVIYMVYGYLVDGLVGNWDGERQEAVITPAHWHLVDYMCYSNSHYENFPFEASPNNIYKALLKSELRPSQPQLVPRIFFFTDLRVQDDNMYNI